MSGSNDNTHYFVKALRKAEPLGLLSSILLVVVAFTFDAGLKSIYNFSLISSSFFILSYVTFSIKFYLEELGNKTKFKSSILHVSKILGYAFAFVGFFHLFLTIIHFAISERLIRNIFSLIIIIFTYGPMAYILQKQYRLKRIKKRHLLLIIIFYVSVVFSSLNAITETYFNYIIISKELDYFIETYFFVPSGSIGLILFARHTLRNNNTKNLLPLAVLILIVGMLGLLYFVYRIFL